MIVWGTQRIYTKDLSLENPGAPLVVLVHAASGSVLPFHQVAERLGIPHYVLDYEARFAKAVMGACPRRSPTRSIVIS